MKMVWKDREADWRLCSQLFPLIEWVSSLPCRAMQYILDIAKFLPIKCASITPVGHAMHKTLALKKYMDIPLEKGAKCQTAEQWGENACKAL